MSIWKQNGEGIVPAYYTNRCRGRGWVLVVLSGVWSRTNFSPRGAKDERLGLVPIRDSR